MRGLVGIIAQNTVGISTQTFSEDQAASHTLTLTLNTDGTYTVSDSVGGTNATGNWILQTQRAARCAVTATFVSEDPGFGGGGTYTGTFGSSLALTSARSWSQTVGADPDALRNVVFDLDFTIDGNPFGPTARITLEVS